MNPQKLRELLDGVRQGVTSIYRPRGIFVFIGLCLGVATFFESVSLRTGFTFGHDRLTDLMGPKI